MRIAWHLFSKSIFQKLLFFSTPSTALILTLRSYPSQQFSTNINITEQKSSHFTCNVPDSGSLHRKNNAFCFGKCHKVIAEHGTASLYSRPYSYYHGTVRSVSGWNILIRGHYCNWRRPCLWVSLVCSEVIGVNTTKKKRCSRLSFPSILYLFTRYYACRNK